MGSLIPLYAICLRNLDISTLLNVGCYFLQVSKVVLAPCYQSSTVIARELNIISQDNNNNKINIPLSNLMLCPINPATLESSLILNFPGFVYALQLGPTVLWGIDPFSALL